MIAGFALKTGKMPGIARKRAQPKIKDKRATIALLARIESPRLASRSPSDRPPLAVALRYEHESRQAPQIVASGRGAIAEHILELAKEHGIAIRQNADLAEMLEAVGVGERIPAAAFAVVAEILFYVLKANGRLPATREART